MDKLSMDSLHDLILDWAHARNLIDGGDSKTQCLKLISEAGELADDLIKGGSVQDSIGDCIVVLSILAAQHGTSLEECMAVAYEDIKDRTGVLLDGVYIKSSDPEYDTAVSTIAARGIRRSS